MSDWHEIQITELFGNCYWAWNAISIQLCKKINVTLGHALATVADLICFRLNSEGERHGGTFRKEKSAEQRSQRQSRKTYREVGIKAVAAAVESTNNAAKQATSVKKLDSTKTNRENE